jgi:hypothetical protein
MASLENIYTHKCREYSDIYEHLPTLRLLTHNCTHITECGVRSVVSSYSFAVGLKDKPNNKLIQVDLDTNDAVVNFGKLCLSEGVYVTFYKQSDLDCPLEATDLLFIDTWHIYGQLKRELARWHPYVQKYIVMHDTTVDEWQGETVRNGWNAEQQSKESGLPVEEIKMGLWPAIEEFLRNNKDWFLLARYFNNNGLTVLARK